MLLRSAAVAITATFFSISLLVVSLPARSAPPPDAPSLPTNSSTRISVVTEGTGPDVILIPGLASSSDVWAASAAQLRSKYRVHLVQVAGFAGAAAGPNATGDVAAPVAKAIADYVTHQQLKRPAVVGHSLGGEVALMLAARHPEQVGRLVVVDALSFFSLLFQANATAESAAPAAATFRDTMLATPKEQADAMQAATITRLVKTASARPALVAAAVRSDRTTVANASYELMTTDLRPELGRILAPVSVIYAYDSLFGQPAANVDALYRSAYAGLTNAPFVRFVRIDDSFHFVMLDQPQRFAEALEAALAAD